MQPSSYPIEFGILRNYWRQFVEGGRVSEIDTFRLDPAVLRSWQRCLPRIDARMRPRPNNIKGNALNTLLRSQSELMTVAIPFMEDMHQFMEGSDSAILLTDGAGCVMAIEGDATARSLVQSRNLGIGAYWSEGNLGTNALGITLLSAMPMQVVGAEHYFQEFHDMTTTAAPIHDVNGRNIGIIAVINVAIKSTSHTLSLAMAVARAISNQLQATLYLSEANHRLAELRTILGSMNEGVVSWDSSGFITHINAVAANMLEISPASSLGQQVDEVIQLPHSMQLAIATHTELHDAEVSLEILSSGHRINALVNLRTISGDDNPISYVAMLRPIEEVRRMVHQQYGNQATLKLEDVFAQSNSMRPVLRQARIAARGTAPVLLNGEGGVGKNHMARAIHNAGERESKPFIAIDCQAVPRELLVSEMLGYGHDSEHSDRPSKFELANEGTIFLDRIESLSMEMQSALLHIIETGHVMRLGSQYPIPVDVRIIAATTINLEEAVAQETFLAHLFYRFGVFALNIPPLRERNEDIPLLAKRFLKRLSKDQDTEIDIAEEALNALCRYPWPGNVRELEMILERAVHYSQEKEIELVHIPEAVRNGRVVAAGTPFAQPVLSVTEAEHEAIMRAGMANNGHLSAMAKQLGIGRTTLWRKMKRYNISPDTFK